METDTTCSMDGSERKSGLEKVGALWQNSSSKKGTYFNLDVNGKKYVVFPNGYKAQEKQPDFIVYRRVKSCKET